MTAPMFICEYRKERRSVASLTSLSRYDISKALVAAGAKGTFFFSECSAFSYTARSSNISPFTRRQQLFVLLLQAKVSIITNVSLDGCIYTEDNAKRVKYAYDKGHQIASHTWSHANLSSLSWDQSESLLSIQVICWALIYVSLSPR